jgi:hypothetical protein
MTNDKGTFYLPKKSIGCWEKILWPHFFQIPLEILALESLAEGQTRPHGLGITQTRSFCKFQFKNTCWNLFKSSKTEKCRTWIEFEIKFIPIVHPDKGYAGQIGVQDGIHSAGECVRAGFAEYVRHVRAWRRFHAPTTLPNLPKTFFFIFIAFIS